MKLCFASNNAHKLQEIRSAVGSAIDIISLYDIGCSEELPETRDTLEGNSLQKAEYVFNHFQVPCFADDTGLEVNSLQGAPGVFSARYAGEQKNSADNIELLLKNLYRVNDRRARFRTVITLIGLENEPIFFEGIINGRITGEPRGHSGFGYDPVFIPEGHDRTFAEMSLRQKNQLSHRAIAVKKLTQYLLKHSRA
ncbi:MAG TPA: non-canonical purine NTP diphosphatase [Ohtaekwangia sp.]